MRKLVFTGLKYVLYKSGKTNGMVQLLPEAKQTAWQVFNLFVQAVNYELKKHRPNSSSVWWDWSARKCWVLSQPGTNVVTWTGRCKWYKKMLGQVLECGRIFKSQMWFERHKAKGMHKKLA